VREPSKRRFRKFSILLLAVVAAFLIVGWLKVRPDRVLKAASGFVSHTLCSETFVSGLDPNQVYAETLRPMRGIRLIDKALRYEVDKTRRQVRTTIAGTFESQAIYRDTLGCIVVRGPERVELSLPNDNQQEAWGFASALEETAGGAVVEPESEKLRAALDRAFAESELPPHRWTKAVVVARQGRVIAERYAPGYGVDTPLIGYSATKSVISALIGILVRQGRLSVEQPAPVAAWRDPNDPRHAITIDQLMRMTSGLALEETNTGRDRASMMLYLARDMAGFAERASLETVPGSKWNYTSGNTLIVSRIIRDAVGGRTADVLQFARRELFGPLGMRSAVLEFDATGTPIGSTYLFASARDWVRFGMLYLDDGVANGRRILPDGWVRYSSSPTLATDYGAGFWTNLGSSENAKQRERGGMPRDSFYAAGRLGQFVAVVPSSRLVVARFGVTHTATGDIEGMVRLVADVIAVLKSQGQER